MGAIDTLTLPAATLLSAAQDQLPDCSSFILPVSLNPSDIHSGISFSRQRCTAGNGRPVVEAVRLPWTVL